MKRKASCHCGAASITVAAAPTEVTSCNCSLCTKYGVLWAYYPASDLVLPATSLTDTYAWNGKHVDFHRCRNCGCVTHWFPRDAKRDRRGINARLLPASVLLKAKVIPRDVTSVGKSAVKRARKKRTT